jgi:hypothetical protein
MRCALLELLVLDMLIKAETWPARSTSQRPKTSTPSLPHHPQHTAYTFMNPMTAHL